MLETIFVMAISREVGYNGIMRLPILTPISKVQQEIIVGTILGDGCLEFNGNVGTRLQIKQCSKHKDYVFWLYRRLKNLCKSRPKQRKDNNQWYFSTRHLKELTSFYELFYINKKKSIPKNIPKLLNSPLSLAVWYMDDGTLDFIPKVHCCPLLCSDNFTFKEARLLVNSLKRNFGIESNVKNYLMREKLHPRIYIKSVTRDKFFSIIRKYILECFNHKLPPL